MRSERLRVKNPAFVAVGAVAAITLATIGCASEGGSERSETTQAAFGTLGRFNLTYYVQPQYDSTPPPAKKFLICMVPHKSIDPGFNRADYKGWFELSIENAAKQWFSRIDAIGMKVKQPDVSTVWATYDRDHEPPGQDVTSLLRYLRPTCPIESSLIVYIGGAAGDGRSRALAPTDPGDTAKMFLTTQQQDPTTKAITTRTPASLGRAMLHEFGHDGIGLMDTYDETDPTRRRCLRYPDNLRVQAQSIMCTNAGMTDEDTYAVQCRWCAAIVSTSNPNFDALTKPCADLQQKKRSDGNRYCDDIGVQSGLPNPGVVTRAVSTGNGDWEDPFTLPGDGSSPLNPNAPAPAQPAVSAPIVSCYPAGGPVLRAYGTPACGGVAPCGVLGPNQALGVGQSLWFASSSLARFPSAPSRPRKTSQS